MLFSEILDLEAQFLIHGAADNESNRYDGVTSPTSRRLTTRRVLRVLISLSHSNSNSMSLSATGDHDAKDNGSIWCRVPAVNVIQIQVQYFQPLTTTVTAARVKQRSLR